MKNNKGFTMVELLAAIAILGLLIIMAFPTIRALQSRNEKRKYEEYGKSLISAAKLYTDSYKDDLFPKGYKNEFATIKTTDLLEKDLIKNDGFSEVSCANNESFIVVAKYGDDYQYCLSMKCKNKANQPIYEEINREGICKTYDTKTVTYLYKSPNGDIKHEDKIIKGDDAYYSLNPTDFGTFNFSSNHQVFLDSWTVEGTSTTYKVGSKVDESLLKNDLTLVANTRQYIYHINYNGNLQTAGTNFTQDCEYDRNCKLAPSNSFARQFFSFISWRDGANTSYIASGDYSNLVETDGGSINLSAAWKYNECDQNVVWNNNFPSDEQVQANGPSTTGLSAVNTYKWVHNAAGDVCTGDNPKREYLFVGVMCRCLLDKATGKYCGARESRAISHITHPEGKAHIYYNDSDNGRKACKGDLNVNSYVKRVCKGFYPDGVNAYHGYVFYTGEVGVYSNFNPTKFWTHSGGDFNDRVTSDQSIDTACDYACKANYPH